MSQLQTDLKHETKEAKEKREAFASYWLAEIGDNLPPGAEYVALVVSSRQSSVGKTLGTDLTAREQTYKFVKQSFLRHLDVKPKRQKFYRILDSIKDPLYVLGLLSWVALSLAGLVYTLVRASNAD